MIPSLQQALNLQVLESEYTPQVLINTLIMLRPHKLIIILQHTKSQKLTG